MNKTVQELLSQIRELEDELRIAIQEQEAKISYQIEGSKVRFDQAVKSAHKRIKTGLFTWLRKSRLQSVLSAPFVYGMILPIGFFDLALTIYQLNCIYCGYGNGVISYAREITSRTEQYWCPIKHARKTMDPHPRYDTFLNYGNAAA